MPETCVLWNWPDILRTIVNVHCNAAWGIYWMEENELFSLYLAYSLLGGRESSADAILKNLPRFFEGADLKHFE